MAAERQVARVIVQPGKLKAQPNCPQTDGLSRMLRAQSHIPCKDGLSGRLRPTAPPKFKSPQDPTFEAQDARVRTHGVDSFPEDAQVRVLRRGWEVHFLRILR